MIFTEPAYFVFIAVSALAFRFLPSKARPWWLFATGLVFYAYFSPAFVAVLLAETIAVYGLAVLVRRGTSGRIVAFVGGLALTIGMLAVYKYGGLIARSASDLGASGLPSFEDVRLPLAISFFTFEFVHYLADARSGKLPDHAPEDFLGFAMFAPTMIAGPIKRFQGFFDQGRLAQATADDVATGTTRILVGLAKKVVIADTMTLWITPLSSSDALAFSTRAEVVWALIAYSIRIYMDFSGYSDIAIGSARLFGITVPENFNWPYIRTNITDFWRSWHMSLTSWIRDYVYIPLGGSRVPSGRQTLNLLAAMAVSGIWHGAAWNFLGWGLYHGALLSIHRLWLGIVKPALPRPATVPRPLERTLAVSGAVAGGALTFSLVTLGWGLFAMPFARFVDMLKLLWTGGL